MSPLFVEPQVGPDTVQELVDAVTQEGGFDATPALVLKWLSRRHRQMCARSGCYRKRVLAGLTEASVQSYPLPPEMTQVDEVQVAGVVYDAGSHRDLADGAQGWIQLSGVSRLGGGLMTADDDASGLVKIAIFPTPTESGKEVVVFGACSPPDLVIGADAGLKIPPEFNDALVNGAVATGLKRLESRGDLAAELEQEFAAACQELRRRTNRLLRGSGPALIRVIGLNA